MLTNSHTTSLLYFSLKGWKNGLLNLGVKGLTVPQPIISSWMECRTHTLENVCNEISDRRMIDWDASSMNWYSKKSLSRLLSNYVVWQMIRDKVSLLSDEFRKARAEFNEKISGVKDTDPRWRICTGVTNDNMGVPIGTLYIKKYFNQSTIEKVGHQKDPNTICGIQRNCYSRFLGHNRHRDNLVFLFNVAVPAEARLA